jgi:K+-sensing histidine kinase KdpD
VCAAVERYAQKNEVRLEWEVAPEISSIVSDQGRLRQVLYTFLAWAVSRSSEGNLVKVCLDLNGSYLNIKMEDQGEPVEDIARVFDPEETPRAGKTDLNELGIIIGRRLLEVMKGSVSLQERETGGLRTLIQLPVGPPKA